MQKSRIRASVVVPTYNASTYLQETLESLLAQLGPTDELIVVDDGSTDNTPSLFEGPKDQKLRYIRQENSGGPARPRNVGCANARGEFIFIFDADDIAEAGKVESSLSALEKVPSADFLFTNFNTIDSAGVHLQSRYVDRYIALEHLKSQPTGDHLYRIPGGDMISGLLQANFVGTSSVVFRKAAWEKTAGFDEQFFHLDDRDMWLQLSLSGDALFLDLCLHNYRDHQGGISKQRLRQQHLERAAMAKRLSLMTLTKQQRDSLRRFAAKNYLRLGYMDFHETDDKHQARRWFLKSFFCIPSISAFKGVLKSVMPNGLYLLLRRG